MPTCDNAFAPWQLYSIIPIHAFTPSSSKQFILFTLFELHDMFETPYSKMACPPNGSIGGSIGKLNGGPFK
jgi:hypothetical protein